MNDYVFGTLALSKVDNVRRFEVIDGGALKRSISQTKKLVVSDVCHSNSLNSANAKHSKLSTILLLSFFVVLMSVPFSMDIINSVSMQSIMANQSQTQITVQPGDTLWSIAHEHSIDGVDTQTLVEALRTWNDLSSAQLKPGMRLTVPSAE